MFLLIKLTHQINDFFSERGYLVSMDLVERHFFVSILVKVFNKEPTTFETYVYLLGSKSEAKAHTFTIQFSSQDEVIVKVLNHYRVTKLFLLYFFCQIF